MFIAFLLYLLMPILVLYAVGLRGTAAVMFIIHAVLLVLAGGLIFGLLLTWLYKPSSYWQAFTYEFYTNAYTASLSAEDPFYKVFAIPYIAIFDFFCIYFKFTFSFGTVGVWIGELISFVFLAALKNVFWPGPREQIED